MRKIAGCARPVDVGSYFAKAKVYCQFHPYFELLQMLSETTLMKMDKYITRIH